MIWLNQGKIFFNSVKSWRGVELCYVTWGGGLFKVRSKSRVAKKEKNQQILVRLILIFHLDLKINLGVIFPCFS